MVSTEMDMVGVSQHTKPSTIFYLTSNLLQNVLPQILQQGASDDRGEMARLVRNI